MNKLIVVVLATALGACASSSAERKPAATAQTEPLPSATHTRTGDTRQHDVHPVAVAPVAPNVREANEAEPETHAVDQSNSDSDLEHTKKIRSAVMQDDSLSASAKNAQIISNQGEVTLRGTVRDAHDKQAIAKYAKQVAGTTHVHDELEIER